MIHNCHKLKLFIKLTKNYNFQLINSFKCIQLNSRINIHPKLCIRNKTYKANFFCKTDSMNLLNPSTRAYSGSTSIYNLPMTFYEELFQVDDKFFTKANFPSHKWSSFIEKKSKTLGKNFNKIFFDTFIVRKCLIVNNINLASSYLGYLKSSDQTLNVFALSYYLLLLGRNINAIDWNSFQSAFTEINKHEPSKLLVLMNIVEALSYTKLFEDSHKYIKKIEVSSPNNKLITSYNSMARGLIKYKNIEAAFEYLKEKSDPMINEIDIKMFLKDETIVDMVKSVNNGPDGYSQKNLINLLKMLGWFEITLTHTKADILSSLIQKEWMSKKLKISNQKRCEFCNAQLKQIQCDEASIRNLKDILENKIKSADIFRYTSPVEWKFFFQFLNNNRPFHVVGDGLNIFLPQCHAENSFLLIKNFLQSLGKKRKKRVLLIAREHAKDIIIQMFGALDFHSNIKYYFLDNRTEDDLFVIYAALHSGLGCKFITGDFLRDHISMIGENQKLIRRQFLRWQISHQLIIEKKTDEFILKQPYQYHRTSQWSEETRSWHIPLESTVELDYMDSSEDWLCIKEITANRQTQNQQKTNHIL